MRLTESELAHIRSVGLYITEKCDHCGKVLNQTFRYTVARKPEVYCSAPCRDRARLGADGLERAAKKRTCLLCQGPKPAYDSPYCLNCQRGASPASDTAQETRCAACGGKVSEIRKTRNGTCSRSCAKELGRRNRRNTCSVVRGPEQKPPLQFIDSTRVKVPHFDTSRPLA